jgi:hypothetical protein
VRTAVGFLAMAVFFAAAAVFSILLVAGPTGQGQDPMWGALFLTPAGLGGAVYAVRMASGASKAKLLFLAVLLTACVGGLVNGVVQIALTDQWHILGEVWWVFPATYFHSSQPGPASSRSAKPKSCAGRTTPPGLSNSAPVIAARRN